MMVILNFMVPRRIKKQDKKGLQGNCVKHKAQGPKSVQQRLQPTGQDWKKGERSLIWDFLVYFFTAIEIKNKKKLYNYKTVWAISHLT